jgi:hypothetical protein
MLRDIFGQIGLKIKAQVKNQVANFLDIMLNWKIKNLHPTERQTTNQPLYFDSRLNHPPYILKQIPISIIKHISSLSSVQESFDECTPFYESALKHSNYNLSLEYSTNSPSLHHLRNEGANETLTRLTPPPPSPPFSKPLKPTSRNVFLCVSICFYIQECIACDSVSMSFYV